MNYFLRCWTINTLFVPMIRRWATYLGWLALILLVLGCWGGLVHAPADFKQGDGFRMMYVHVPSAFLSLGIYVGMTIAAFIALVWRIKMADVWIEASAPLGAMFTGVALITGAIWGKPMWGTWWIWDARLTAELLLFFLYCGAMVMRSVGRTQQQGQFGAQVIVLMGSINIPIVHYAVDWWHTLHQGPTLAKFSVPAIAPEMLWPLLVMLAGSGLFYLWAVLSSMRQIIMQRDRRFHEHSN